MGADTWASYTPHACSPAAMLPLQEQVCSPRKVSYGEWKLGTGTRTAVEGGAESERVRSEQAVWPRGAHLTCRTGSHLLSCTSLAPRQWSIFRIVQTALRRGWPAQGTPGPNEKTELLAVSYSDAEVAGAVCSPHCLLLTVRGVSGQPDCRPREKF